MANSQKTNAMALAGGTQYVFKCMKKALERSTPGIKHELHLNKAVYKEEPGTVWVSTHGGLIYLIFGPFGRGGKRLRFEGLGWKRIRLICSVPVVESKERDSPGGPGAKTPSSQSIPGQECISHSATKIEDPACQPRPSAAKY